MAVREILLVGHPLLRKRAKKIHRFDPALRALVDDLFATLGAAGGVGLAGPQIGQALRVFVAEYDGHKVALCNPEIGHAEGEEVGPAGWAEGCLRIPGYAGVNIRRAARLLVKGQDSRGKAIRVPAEGWFARILQHELDHLDGILFLDRLERPEDLHAARATGGGEAAAAVG